MKLFGGKHSAKRNDTGHRSGARKAEASSDQPEKTASPEKAKSARKHRLTGLQRGLILLGLSILILAGTVFGVYKALVKPPELPTRPNPIKTTDGEKETDPTKDVDPIRYVDDDGNEVEVQFEMPGSHVKGRYNILLLGTDGDGTRTDTIMVAHMDTIEHKVALMSIPRDTLIYGNYSVPKINSVYGSAGKGEKGIKALQKQLSSILGFEVDGYAMVNLEAFVKIIDVIGGVPFYVPQRMYYNDPTQNLHIDLYEGDQVLDGQHAMQLVRFRKWAAGDIKRTQTQRDFLKALADKLISLKTITKIQPIIEICVEYVDTDLTLGNILYFAQELLKCDLSEMVSVSLPGNNTAIGNGSYWYLYAKQVLEIVNESFNPYDTDIPLSSLHIRTGGSASSGSAKPSGSQTAPKPQEPEPPVEDPNAPNGSSALDPLPGQEPLDPNAPLEPTDPNNPVDPGVTGPGTTDPNIVDPGTTDPGTVDPGVTDPGTTDPGTPDPGTTNPTTENPGIVEPGPQPQPPFEEPNDTGILELP